MLFCHPESEAKAARHRGLGKEKGVVGLPGFAYLTETGEVIVQVPPSEHSIEQLRTYLQRARQLLAWRAAASRGDARAAAALLIAQLEERQLDRTQAAARRAALTGETAEERARLDALLLDLRIQGEISGAGSDLDARRKLGARYLESLRTGPRPSPQVSRGFWFVILEHCEASADAEGYAQGLDGLRQNVALTSGGAEWGKKMIAEYEEKLRRLQGGK